MSAAPDTRPPRLCPHCYAGTPPEATTCWLCQSALPAYEERPANEVAELQPRRGPAPTTTRWEPDFFLWAFATGLACLLLVVLLIDLGILGGLGYALLATVFAAPVLSALATMMWVRWPKEVPDGAVRGEAKEPSDAARVIGGVAMTVTAVFAVIGLVALLILALLVLAFIACMAAYGTNF